MRQFAFEPLVDPAPPVGIWNVHEFCADRATVETSSKRALLSGRIEFGRRSRHEAAERIQVGLEITPASERVENLFTRFVCSDATLDAVVSLLKVMING